MLNGPKALAASGNIAARVGPLSFLENSQALKKSPAMMKLPKFLAQPNTFILGNNLFHSFSAELLRRVKENCVRFTESFHANEKQRAIVVYLWKTKKGPALGQPPYVQGIAVNVLEDLIEIDVKNASIGRIKFRYALVVASTF